jgi:t-SNARE complex subunit (syntaxin)
MIMSDKDHRHHSDTWLIQNQLQQCLPALSNKLKQEISSDLLEACTQRYNEIRKLEEEVRCVKEMYSDLANLVTNQQTNIEAISASLRRAESHVESAERNLLKKEQKKCVIS